jgi:hypothetical protein
VNFIAIDNGSLNFQARQQCLRPQLSPATQVCGAFHPQTFIRYIMSDSLLAAISMDALTKLIGAVIALISL